MPPPHPVHVASRLAPYLDDGSAESPEAAIVEGHRGEAEGASSRFQALSFDERSKVLEFLNSL